MLELLVAVLDVLAMLAEVLGILLVEVLVAEMLEVLVLFVSGGKSVEGCM